MGRGCKACGRGCVCVEGGHGEPTRHARTPRGYPVACQEIKHPTCPGTAVCGPQRSQSDSLKQRAVQADLPPWVFVMIRHHKVTTSGDAKKSSTVLELKRLVKGILKWPPAQGAALHR